MIQYSPGQTVRNLEIIEEDNTGSPYSYYQYQTIDASWLIQRKETIDATNGIYKYRYAGTVNNASYSTPLSAWTSRASLTYDYLSLVVA